MARTLTGMVLDLTLDEQRAELFGGLLYPNGQRELLHRVLLSSGDQPAWDADLRESYGDRVTLRPTAPFSGIYATGAAGAAILGTYLRTVPAAKQWAALEMLHSEPDGTSVRFLLGNAAGLAQRWTGAAWAVVTNLSVEASWNTAAEVAAGFPFWTGTALRVLFRLETSDETVTPVVYGARALVRIFSPSPDEDLVHRTLLPWLAQLQISARLQVRADGSGFVDLSGLEEYRLRDETNAFALEVVSVHNVTGDPGEATELLSAWSPATALATLVAAQTEGDLLQLDLLVRPIAARATSQDFFELARLPAVVLEQLRLEPWGQSHGLHGRTLVRDTSALTARRIPTPLHLTATFQLRLVAQYDTDLHRFIGALEVSQAAPSSAPSGHPVSAITGEPLRLRRLTGWTEQDGGLSATSMWQARGMQALRGPDELALLIGSVSVDPQEIPVE